MKMENLTMLLCVLFLGLVAVSGAPGGAEMNHEDLIDFLKASSVDCAEKYNDGTPFTDDEIEGFTKEEETESKNVKCLRACLLKKFELINDDGKLSDTKFIEMVEVADSGKGPAVEEIVTKCNADITEEEECEKAHLYSMCVLDAMKAQGIKYPK